MNISNLMNGMGYSIRKGKETLVTKTIFDMS
jgi:hypothetical protein